MASTRDPRPSGAYAQLDDLVRLRHKAVGFSFLPRQPVHSVLAGRHGSRLRGRGFDFEEIRHYVAGDDPRSFDWRVPARLREPHVRVFTEERDRPVLLVVDQRGPMFFGSRQRMKSVTAAEAAALAGWRVLEQGDRVGALVFDDRELVEVRPQRSRRNQMRILHEIVRLNHGLPTPHDVAERPEALVEALEKAARLARHDWLVVVISDFHGGDERARELLSRIARHNDVLVVFVHDRLEEQLPDAGRLVFADGEFQLEVDSGDAKLRERFRQRFAERLEQARRFLLRRAVPVLPIHTGADVADQARALLGAARSQRRGR